MTLRPVLNSSRVASSLALLLLWLAAIPVLPSGISAQAADTDDSGNNRWTPTQLADGVEAAIARVTSSELSTRYIERRNTNVYGKGDAVFASGTGRSLFRADGTRWYCDDDGFTTSFGKPGSTPRRVESGFDGDVHFEKNRHIVTYGEDNLSVWQYSAGRVFWGAGRDTDFLLGRLRDENAKVVSDETVEDRRQVTVKAGWSWGETAYEYQVTLLPDHSFLPVEATVTVNGNPDAEWSASGLKQTDGLWYPSKVSRKRFVGKKLDRDRRTTVTAFRLRDDFNDSDFQLDSTISLDIVDHRTGTAFHNSPWWNDLAPFLRRRLNWPQRDMHSANDYAKYGNDNLIGKPAPKLSVAEWINGDPTQLTAEGRHLTLLIFFGGRAISPSPRTLAALNNLRRIYHENGLEVIGIASASDTLDLTRRDVKSLQLTFPVAIDSSNDDPDGNRYGTTFQAYGLKSYYGFFLIGSNGNVLKLRPAKDLLADIGKKPGVAGEFDLRTNVIRVLYDAGEKDIPIGESDLIQLDLPQIKVIEPEWKRLLKNSPRTAQLTGTITDGENPIAGATIQATPTLRLLFSYSPGGYFLSVDRDQRFTFKTDNDGHFDAGGLPKGVWQLLIRKPGHASLEKNVTLENARSAVELNIENSQKDRIFGRVLNQNGDPVVRASVKVDKRHPDPKRPTITTTAHLPKQKAVTDQEGRFEITRLYDGTYTLVVNAANFESATKPHVSADGKEVVIRLKPRATKTSRAGSLTPFAGFAQVAEQKREESRSSETSGFPTSGTVTGTVVDENGKPIAKALAVLETHPTRTPDRSPVKVTAVSNKRGRFTLKLTEPFFQRALQETALKERIDCPLTLWSKGRPIERRIVTLRKTLAWQTNAGPIPLIPGTDVAFRVLSPNGNAVSNAEVRVTGQYPGDHPHIPVALQEAMAGESDKDGLVLFPGLLRGRAVFVVSYRSEEFGTQSARFQIVRPPEQPLDLAFEPGGTVAGKIRCTDPKQLAKLELEVMTEIDPAIAFRLGIAIVRSRSSTVTVQPDSDGEFTIKGLTPGLLRVRQISTDEKSWRLKLLPITQTVEVGAVTEFSAELVPTVPIEGFIVDKQTGEPLTESTVEVTSVNSPQNWAAPKTKVPLSVRPDGSFIGAVIPGKYQLSVRTMVPGFSRIKVAHVTVPADAETAEVKVFIPRTLSMQAELVDEDGLPVGNAWVAAMSGKKLLMLKRASEIGIFEAWLADVSRADHWQVRIGKQRLSGTVINKVPLKLQVSLKSGADVVPAEKPTIREQGMTSPHIRRVAFSGFARVADEEPGTAASDESDESATTGQVTGRVLDPDGKPLSGASVAIISPFTDDLSEVHDFVRAETDADGTFQLDIKMSFATQQRGNHVNLPSLGARIMAWHSDVGFVAQNIQMTRVDDGRWSAASLELTLGKRTPQRVRILNWDGSPAAGVKVFIRHITASRPEGPHVGLLLPRKLSPVFHFESDKDGIIEVGILPAHTRSNSSLCRLEASGRTTGVQSFFLNPAPGRLEYQWQLHPYGPLAGQLHFEGTARPEPLTLDVTIRHPSGAALRQFGKQEFVKTDPTGRFELPNAVVGSIQIRHVNWRQSPWRVHITDGWITPAKLKGENKLRLDLKVTHGRRVTGRLIDLERGRVLAGKEISFASSPYGVWHGHLTTDEQGHFSERLAPGRYTFSYAGSRQHVTVPEGKGDITLEPLPISRGLGFQGEIVDQDEKPVANAWVRATVDGETVLLKRVSDTGEFEVWQSELNEATNWSVRAGGHRYRATLLQKLPPRLQIDTSQTLEAGSEDADR